MLVRNFLSRRLLKSVAMATFLTGSCASDPPILGVDAAIGGDGQDDDTAGTSTREDQDSDSFVVQETGGFDRDTDVAERLDRDVAVETAGAGDSGSSRYDAGDLLGNACIQLSDLPMAMLWDADTSQPVSSLRILEGPCGSPGSPDVVFPYYSNGYSCPNEGDSVVCKVQVTSRRGSVAIVDVTFVAISTVGLLHWVAKDAEYSSVPTVWVKFPSLDGGAGDSSPGG